MNRPIEILGGGLAGLSLGLALRRRDIPVTLFEAGDYPRHRVCGEFVTGLSQETMDQLGLGEVFSDALHHSNVAWFVRDREVRHQRLPSPALGLSRFVLDARLAAAFRDAGGILHCRTRIADETTPPGRVFATGRRRGAPTWLGLKIHLSDLPLSRELEIHLGQAAYVGLSRIENNRVNLCGLFRCRPIAAKGPDLLLRYLQAAGLSSLASRLSTAEFHDASFSAVAALSFDRKVPVCDGRIELGDACAMIPPFTGNGMAIAFQSAETALNPLLAYAGGEIAWPEAVRETNRLLRARFRVRLAAASVMHPYLLEPVRQRCLSWLNRACLIPLRPLYAALH